MPAPLTHAQDGLRGVVGLRLGVASLHGVEDSACPWRVPVVLLGPRGTPAPTGLPCGSSPSGICAKLVVVEHYGLEQTP